MKTLVVVTHPDMEKSVINRRWAEELKKHPERFTVHELYREYPDGRIDVRREQALVEAHGSLILQFPVYWFSCPSLLKKWMDEVLAFGWAFGPQPGADKMKDRKVALAVSAGVQAEDFGPQGKYRYTLDEMVVPFKAMCLYVDASFQPFFAFYGAEDASAAGRLETSARDYLRFALNL